MSPRFPPKISQRHDWTKELGSKVDRQPEGKLLDSQKEKLLDKQNSSNQPNQFQIQFQIQFVIDQGNLASRKTWSVFKHVHLKTARVSMLSRLMIDQGNLVKTQLQYKTTLKYIMRPERSTLTMRQFVKELRQTWTSKFQDYHILLWSTRKSASVRELIQKIENHPNRHALKRDLRQSQSFNPFSPESKQMIHEVGNIELCELLETEPKTQCKVCLSYWDIGIV